MVFAATRTYTDPKTKERRHHLHETVLRGRFAWLCWRRELQRFSAHEYRHTVAEVRGPSAP